MSWTTPEDIKDRWVSSDPIPSDTKLSVFIADVERQIKNHYKEIQDRIDAGLIEVDYIKQIVSTIIIEFLFTKGQPFTYESQSYSGAGSQSVGYSATKARLSLILTPEDLELFAPTKTGGILSISVAPDMRSTAPTGKIIGWTTTGVPIRYIHKEV